MGPTEEENGTESPPLRMIPVYISLFKPRWGQQLHWALWLPGEAVFEVSGEPLPRASSSAASDAEGMNGNEKEQSDAMARTRDGGGGQEERPQDGKEATGLPKKGEGKRSLPRGGFRREVLHGCSPHASPDWVRDVFVGGVPKERTGDVFVTAARVPVANSVAHWTDQDYVLDLLDALCDERLLDDFSQDYVDGVHEAKEDFYGPMPSGLAW